MERRPKLDELVITQEIPLSQNITVDAATIYGPNTKSSAFIHCNLHKIHTLLRC